MAGEPELQSGSEGEWVTYLQQCLVAIGYLVDSPDGSFGPPTVEAVQRSQATFGLDANGIVGPSTWDALTGAVGQAQRGNVTAAADPQAATSASSDPAASQQSAQQKFEAKLQQHQAKFDELSSGAIAEAKGRLTNVRINCLNASLRFFQQEYQLVEAIQAPKVTKDSSIGAEIAKGLLSVALATVPEYAVTKAVVSVFFNSAANHLGQTAPDPVSTSRLRRTSCVRLSERCRTPSRKRSIILTPTSTALTSRSSNTSESTSLRRRTSRLCRCRAMSSGGSQIRSTSRMRR
jgi:hypothetical protein